MPASDLYPSLRLDRLTFRVVEKTKVNVGQFLSVPETIEAVMGDKAKHEAQKCKKMVARLNKRLAYWKKRVSIMKSKARHYRRLNRNTSARLAGRVMQWNYDNGLGI